ncbi:hypothetical protein SEVIR_5G274401v4 [Setaria viridis]
MSFSLGPFSTAFSGYVYGSFAAWQYAPLGRRSFGAATAVACAPAVRPSSRTAQCSTHAAARDIVPRHSPHSRDGLPGMAPCAQPHERSGDTPWRGGTACGALHGVHGLRRTPSRRNPRLEVPSVPGYQLSRPRGGYNGEGSGGHRQRGDLVQSVGLQDDGDGSGWAVRTGRGDFGRRGRGWIEEEDG